MNEERQETQRCLCTCWPCNVRPKGQVLLDHCGNRNTGCNM